MTFWERLVAGCVATGQEPPTAAELARFLGIQRSAVTKYVQGHFPKKRNINRVALRYGLNSAWLLSGQGEMVSEESMDEKTLAFLRVWRSLDDDGRDRLLANALYEQQVRTSTSTAGHRALTEDIIRDIGRREGRPSKPDKPEKH